MGPRILAYSYLLDHDLCMDLGWVASQIPTYFTSRVKSSREMKDLLSS